MRFVDRSVEDVTFQGKLGLPIHRWYRLTPSFSPRLADDIATHFAMGPADRVLDPFSGVGTVPLCMKYRGIPAVGIELNPFLHFVGSVKTRTRTERAVDQFERSVRDFLARLREDVGGLPDERRAARYLEENAGDVPGIHRPDRWWSAGNLMQLVCVRRLLKAFEAALDDRELLAMGVLGILVPVSNARHNHVSLTFAAEPGPTFDLAAVLERKYAEMIADLRSVAGKTCSEVVIHRGNSKEAATVLRKARADVSAVITSPPYPNRFSYARETRPHLFFLDFVASAAAVGQLEVDGIGGTWGKATSILARGVAPANERIAGLLDPYITRFGERGGLMAAYVTKYFNDLYQHAGEIARVCRPNCRLAYVIGNSKFFGQPLPSDELLAEIFGEFGFGLDRIDRMRRRQSKSGLYEAVVFMRR